MNTESDNHNTLSEEERLRLEAQEKQRVSRSVLTLMVSAWRFIRSVLNLRSGLDMAATSEGIRADVEFRGHAAWVLICSIIIACIGLSTGSGAIIIGAMLISPLMGPILGVGLASATNDFDLLKKSLKNFSIAIIISVFIAWLYFVLIPVPQINLELQGRKDATILAIGVALMGGLAGIIAGSRSSKSNVVPGVAIATALMPPLCTVGFGLATRNWNFFLGASYLFFINSVFIALPTYAYIKYMGFPVKEFVDPKRERKIKYIFIGFILLVMTPSAYLFYRVMKKDFYYRDAQYFLTDIHKKLEYKNAYVIEENISYTPENKVIKIALMGQTLGDDVISEWRDQLPKYNLEGTHFLVVQNEDYSKAIASLEEKSLISSKEFMHDLLQQKEHQIDSLTMTIGKYEAAQINFNQIANEIRSQYPSIQKVAYAQLIQSGLGQPIDTIPTVMLSWEEGLGSAEIERREAVMQRWLRTRLLADSLVVVSY